VEATRRARCSSGPYDEQDELVKAAKTGEPQLRAASTGDGGRRSWPASTRGDQTEAQPALHFAADNAIPSRRRKWYLGDVKICDEDTDLGLRYTLGQIAPEVIP